MCPAASYLRAKQICGKKPKKLAFPLHQSLKPTNFAHRNEKNRTASHLPRPTKSNVCGRRDWLLVIGEGSGLNPWWVWLPQKTKEALRCYV